MKRVAAAEFEQVFDIDTLREPAALAAMQTFYQTHGVVCISLERKIDVREVVGEMLESLMGDLPYSDEYMLSLRSASGRELHIKNRDDREDMITELLRSPISPVNLKRLELAVPPHREFGAPCTAQSFHGAWANRLRQDPDIYEVVVALLGSTDINCDLNRSILLIPGQGQHKMLHWDCDPRAQTSDADSHIQGKVLFTPSKFVCVPGTHTKKFLDEFYPLYDPLYPKRPAGQAMYGLDPARDPLGLFEQERAFTVPARSLVLWNTKLLHGHPKLRRDEGISFGCYLGFHPEISAAERAVRQALHREGAVPQKWPSGAAISFFPRKYYNFPKVFESMVIKKLSEQAREQLLATRVTTKGDIVKSVRPWGWKPGSYTPFDFTPLGKRIAGLEAWGSGGERAAKRAHGVP